MELGNKGPQVLPQLQPVQWRHYGSPHPPFPPLLPPYLMSLSVNVYSSERSQDGLAIKYIVKVHARLHVFEMSCSTFTPYLPNQAAVFCVAFVACTMLNKLVAYGAEGHLLNMKTYFSHRVCALYVLCSDTSHPFTAK